jgi:hypothetical protein
VKEDLGRLRLPAHDEPPVLSDDPDYAWTTSHSTLKQYNPPPELIGGGASRSPVGDR